MVNLCGEVGLTLEVLKMIATKKYMLSFLLFISVIFYSTACEINYYISDNNGESRSVSPDKKTLLNNGESYTLHVDYLQDHGRCDVKYDDTLFILEDEKWKTSKDYLPLVLTTKIIWSGISKRNFETAIKFNVKESGSFNLEIIRDCDRKEGYDESLQFQVN